VNSDEDKKSQPTGSSGTENKKNSSCRESTEATAVSTAEKKETTGRQAYRLLRMIFFRKS